MNKNEDTSNEWVIDVSSITNNTSTFADDTSMVSVNMAGARGGGGSGATYYTGYAPGYGPIPSTVNITTSGTTYSPSTFTIGSGTSNSGSIGMNTSYTTGTYNPNNTHISIMGPNPTIQTDKNKINLDELAETMSVLRERLLILVPNFEKHEKYQALKKAYDHYKMIEALIQEEQKDVK